MYLNHQQRAAVGLVLLLAALLQVGQHMLYRRAGWNYVQAADADSEEQWSADLEDQVGICSLVHVNRASAELLETLPGIGPAYAANIIAAREKEPFREIQDLLRVQGIGEKRLEKIRPLICLDDCADE